MRALLALSCIALAIYAYNRNQKVDDLTTQITTMQSQLAAAQRVAPQPTPASSIQWDYDSGLTTPHFSKITH